MKISRPLLKVNEKFSVFFTTNFILFFFKALSAMGLHSPTPIQAATIPLALLGRDICACAVTGSGYLIKSLLYNFYSNEFF